MVYLSWNSERSAGSHNLSKDSHNLSKDAQVNAVSGVQTEHRGGDAVRNQMPTGDVKEGDSVMMRARLDVSYDNDDRNS